jgi:hypothetical protein
LLVIQMSASKVSISVWMTSSWGQLCSNVAD